MFGEPLLAHPAERGGVHASRHPHSWDQHDRDQHDDDTDGEQHMVLRIKYAPRDRRRSAIGDSAP